MSETQELIGTKFNIKCQYLWHSTHIYCLAFDRKGKYIFTGGDDGVVKVYSIAKDELIKSLSDQNSDEFTNSVEEVCRKIDFQSDIETNIETLLEQFAICDIAVNHENTLVSAGKHNGCILVWNLQTFDLVTKFEEQTFPIRSVLFGSAIFDKNKKFLISTSEDGFIFFYVYNCKTLKFEPKSVHRRSKYDGERAVNICVDMTTGGLLLGLMHTFGQKQEISKPKSKKEPLIKCDSHSAIRIFSLSDEMGLKEEWKTTYHKSHSDCVYSLRFSHNTFRFASACDKDSNAFIWTYDKSNKKWDSIIIGINTKGDTKKLLRGKSKQLIESVFVDEIVFSCDDKYMMTVLTDFSIKVWNSESGDLVRHFAKYHFEKISIVDCHPSNGHIFISAGYDSNIFIYDTKNGTILNHFDCSVNTQLIKDNHLVDNWVTIKPLILQCGFSPDGKTIATTDNFGNLTVFSLESRKEADCIDKLEELLATMHSDSDEDNCLNETIITPSEEISKFNKTMFDYESDLLRGIERPSPLKQSQTSDDKKVDLKSIRKLDFETSNCLPEQTNDVKSSPAMNKSKRKTPAIKLTETISKNKTGLKGDSPPKERETPLKSKTTVGPKQQSKFAKRIYSAILDKIFENPSSRPFQVNDHIQYPTYRKEISDADLCLTSIREDMLLNNRYSFIKFNRDMNKVMENAKSFYKHIDDEVYEMALTLERFYCNKMETQFGTSFKPPKNVVSSDDDMSQSSLDSKPVPVITETKHLSDKSETVSPIETIPSPLRSQKIPKETPKLNGKQTLKTQKATKETLNLENSSSNRKRTTVTNKSDSDLESTPGKRTKIIDKSDKSLEESPKTDETPDENAIKDVIEDNPSIENIPENDESIQNDEGCNIDILGDKSIGLQTEQLDDFGILAEEEEIGDGDQIKTQKPIEESVSKSLVNGKPNELEVKSCDISTESHHLKNCLFCIFCDKIFWSVNETKSHYIRHLCPIRCSNCDELFTLYELYLSHDCGHPKTPNNIEWCRQYSDCINWIEKFIGFQQTEDIELFETIIQTKSCIVCEKVKQFRPESNLKPKDIKSVDALHLEKHLKYIPQYQCLFCLLNNDKYFYCRNSDEAEKHLSAEHKSFSKSNSSLQYFDGSIPKLDEIILQLHS